MVTIKDVAKEAGVAISTVSNVLNGQGNISEEIKMNVLKATKNLNYKPNLNAKLLRSGTNKIIGVFLSTLQGEFYASFIQAIQMKCTQAGYILQIFIIAEDNPKENMRIMTAFGLSGVIIFNEFITNEMINRLAYANIPTVLCDREYVDFLVSSITIDNYGSSCEVMEYLLKKGHKNIGFISGVDVQDNRLRYQAYLDTMKKYNLPIQSNWIWQGQYNSEVTYHLVCKFMEENAQLPNAIFSANDQMAIGCIDALKKYNIKVPQDISIAGYDDELLASYYTPTLTTVAAPFIELGKKSVDEVLRLIEVEDISRGRKEVLQAQLIKRSSVK